MILSFCLFLLPSIVSVMQNKARNAGAVFTIQRAVDKVSRLSMSLTCVCLGGQRPLFRFAVTGCPTYKYILNNVSHSIIMIP